jgi:hypothetical protein
VLQADDHPPVRDHGSHVSAPLLGHQAAVLQHVCSARFLLCAGRLRSGGERLCSGVCGSRRLRSRVCGSGRVRSGVCGSGRVRSGVCGSGRVRSGVCGSGRVRPGSGRVRSGVCGSGCLCPGLCGSRRLCSGSGRLRPGVCQHLRGSGRVRSGVRQHLCGSVGLCSELQHGLRNGLRPQEPAVGSVQPPEEQELRLGLQHLLGDDLCGAGLVLPDALLQRRSVRDRHADLRVADGLLREGSPSGSRQAR